MSEIFKSGFDKANTSSLTDFMSVLSYGMYLLKDVVGFEDPPLLKVPLAFLYTADRTVVAPMAHVSICVQPLQ